MSSWVIFLVTFCGDFIPIPWKCHWFHPLTGPDQDYFSITGWGGYQLSFWTHIPFTLAITWILFLHSCTVGVCMCPFVMDDVRQALSLSTLWLLPNVTLQARWETLTIWKIPKWAKTLIRTPITKGVSGNLTLYPVKYY